MMVQSKVTFKTIPHYPDLVIREAACNINQTWENFLKSFGVDLTRVAPGVKFLVRSRKGTSSLLDKIEIIASKYVQRYRILVSIEKDTGKAQFRRPRKRRPRPPVKHDSNFIPRVAAGSFPTEVDISDGVQPPTRPSTNSENVRSPYLLSALKRSIVKRMRTPQPDSTSVALQLEMLREMARFEQVMAVSDGYNNYDPSVSSSPGQPSPFPSFSSIMGPGNLNFETRVEKIEDYNVIRKSSVIWQDHGGLMRVDTEMRCFSMNDDDDFIL